MLEATQTSEAIYSGSKAAYICVCLSIPLAEELELLTGFFPCVAMGIVESGRITRSSTVILGNRSEALLSTQGPFLLLWDDAESQLILSSIIRASYRSRTSCQTGFL